MATATATLGLKCRGVSAKRSEASDARKPGNVRRMTSAAVRRWPASFRWEFPPVREANLIRRPARSETEAGW